MLKFKGEIEIPHPDFCQTEEGECRYLESPYSIPQGGNYKLHCGKLSREIDVFNGKVWRLGLCKDCFNKRG
jgi:hypothetical protein